MNDYTDYFPVDSGAFDSTQIYTPEIYSDPAAVDYGFDVPVFSGIDPGSLRTVTSTDGTASGINDDGSVTTNLPDGSVTTVFTDGTGYNLDARGNVTATDSYGTKINVTPDAIPRSTSDFSGALTELTRSAVAVVGALTAFKNAGQPQARAATPIQQSTGAIVAPMRNGTIQTKLPGGKTTVTKMPVGQPYVFADGSTVVNNGNGTQTTVSPNGQTTVSKIPDTGGNAGMILAVGLGLMLVSQ